MQIRGSGLAAMCVAAIATASPAAAQGTSDTRRLEQLKDPDVRTLLIELKADVDRYQQEWLAARAALDTAEDTLAAIKARIDRDKRLRDRLKIEPDATLTAQDQAALTEQEAEVKKLGTALTPKWERYRDERNRFELYFAAAQNKENPDVHVVAPELREMPPRLVFRTGERCSIDSEPDRIALDPNECRWDAEAAGRHQRPAAAGLTPSRVSLPDRPLERRGVTAQLTTSGTTSLSLKIADTFNWRSFAPEVIEPEARFQRTFNWGYSLGIEADVADSKGQIFGFAEDDEEGTAAIDRIDQRLKLTGSLSFNLFDGESRRSFAERGATMQRAAQEACRTDQAAKAPSQRSTCAEEDLLAWIFAQNKEGAYANPTHVEAFNAVYWGSPVKTARAGIGLTASLARPRIDYYPFAFIEVPDPLRPGQTKKVVDLANLPAGFAAGEAIRERHWAYDVGLYTFLRLTDDRAPVGMTIVPSITYKHDYKKPDKISICPAPATAAALVSSELCQSVHAADAKLETGWVPALELRVRFAGLPGFSFLGGRGLIPEMGIAPKLGLDGDRWSFAMPIWFTADDKGKLSGGLIFARQWGGDKDDGSPRASSTSVSVFLGTTFDLGSGK